MQLDDNKIEKILLDGSYISADDLKKAQQYAKEHHATSLVYLQNEGLINRNLLGQAIAESLNVDYASLPAQQPTKEQVLKIPEDIANKYHIVLFKETPKEVVVATDDPAATDLSKALKQIFKTQKISLAYSLPEDIDTAFIAYRKTLETRFGDIIKKQEHIAPEIIDEIIEDAIAYHASDIHFEPQSKEVVIRFRVDGVLNEAGRIPKEYFGNVLNRIKVQSHLPIDEHYSAQDGAMRFVKENMTADLRVSILPTLDGEKVVMRLLSQYVRGFNLPDLGLSPENEILLEKAYKKPFGMILITGPTGSGKTTSLYALLRILNTPNVNITTIEDPVEYRVEGINQIQVNPKTNLTFAGGLRSIVRQDPDIILVGEIRDNETAEIAINASLTGHLLLSTFHANDSATAVPRLLDMKIEPFLLASTLELLIAQRLVRKICEQCKVSSVIKQIDIKKTVPELARKYFTGKSYTFYKGKGCSACGNTGYKGRQAIFEFIPISPEMKELILKNPSTQEIWKVARKQGSKTLFEDGLEKVKNGITTLQELLRVAEPPKF
ncbi:MAG: ATPase, T2SS/T4P/T4SS family [Candidatus Magasanikbacteria bacterium]